MNIPNNLTDAELYILQMLTQMKRQPLRKPKPEPYTGPPRNRAERRAISNGKPDRAVPNE